MRDYPETITTTVLNNGKFEQHTIHDSDSVICHGKKRTVRLGGIFCPRPFIPIINDNHAIVLVKLNEIQIIMNV